MILPADRIRPRAATPPLRGGGSRSRGSVLVVALLVAALIALVLGSYLSINLGAARLSLRTFNRGAAFHLAEAGLEEGLWTYNRLLANQPDAWDGWQVSGGSAWRRFDGFQLSPSISGTVKVYASPTAPGADAQPIVVALASVQNKGGVPVTQMLEVTLRRRSLFAAGIVAREAFAVRGRNNTFDAWNSDPDKNAATPAVAYSAAVRSDTIDIATGADTPAELGLGAAQIYGTLAARVSPAVSAPGRIGGFDTKPGVIDSSRVTSGYSDNFPVVSAPAGGTFVSPFGPTLGVAGQSTSWRAPSLRLSGGDTLTILGNVTLVLTDPIEGLSLTGGAALIIPEGSSLALYVAGDISIGGRGVVNTNPSPAALQIWSTATPARPPTITLAGRAALSAIIYAPEADLKVNGTTELAGSIIARWVTFVGNAAFHYDEALNQLSVNASYGATSWTTVTDPARRAELLRLVDK